ncbi:MAG: hypothetical protein N2662_10620 [Bacteroidales bacterium]|nr:hypothetical protein [Bacteroidales bacterium]
MKKKMLFYAAGIVALMITSCGKEENGGGSDINLDNPTFAKKTVAETKADLENSGTKMVGELKSLNQEKGMQASVMFVSLMGGDNSAVAYKFKASGSYKVLYAVSKLSARPQLKPVLKAMDEGEDDLTSLLDSFDAYTGVYEYDFTTESFSTEPVEPSNSIIFRFPSNKENYDAQVLNASLEIPRPQIVEGNFSLVNATALPSNIAFYIKVDGVTALSYTFVAEYKPDGIPTKVENTLTMGTWEMKQTYGYSETKLSLNYSFKHGSTNIISFGGEVKGNLTKDGVENAKDSTWVELFPGEGYYQYDYKFEKVVQNANAYFQLMDIKIVGQMDFQHLVPIMDDQNKTPEQQAEAMNQYADLVVVYASNNQAIAKAEAYVVEETDEWGETHRKVDMRLIFADNSKSTLDSYFQEGFDGLIDEMNSLIAELNQTYGWKLEPIEKNTQN